MLVLRVVLEQILKSCTFKISLWLVRVYLFNVWAFHLPFCPYHLVTSLIFIVHVCINYYCKIVYTIFICTDWNTSDFKQNDTHPNTIISLGTSVFALLLIFDICLTTERYITILPASFIWRGVTPWPPIVIRVPTEVLVAPETSPFMSVRKLAVPALTVKAAIGRVCCSSVVFAFCIL